MIPMCAIDDEELMQILHQAIHDSISILASTDEPLSIWAKKNLANKTEIVTSKDLKIEQCFREHLLVRYPNAIIVSEETNSGPGIMSAPVCFVIDPIDGTQEYVNGTPHYAVSVAAIIEGQLSHGVVAYPSYDLIIKATAGRGATVNHERLIISHEQPSHGPIRLGVSPSEINSEQLAHVCSQIPDTEIVVIPTFTAKGGAVARQILDVALYFSVFGVAYIWDYAAIALVLQEAGYSCTDIAGNCLSQSLPFVHKGGWIAGAPTLLPRFYSAIREFRKSV